jgi:kynurenine formamidase
MFFIDGGESEGLGDMLASWPSRRVDDEVLSGYWSTRTRFADDSVFMNLQSATQWDALSHVWYDGKLYNGFDSEWVTSRGALRNGVEKVLAKGIVGRGVLLDVARFRGVDNLPTRTPIYADELQAVCAAQGVTIRSGDILMVRTGWWSTYRPGENSKSWRLGCPGLHWTAAQWLHDVEVAAVAVDNMAVEVHGRHVAEAMLPLHLLCLRDMGVMLGEFWDLDALAADCADDGRYEMQVVAPPLNIPGAVGSPLNPLAMK